MEAESIIRALGSADTRAANRAFTGLYDLFAQDMLRFFVHRGLSGDEAKDVLQETFIRVLGGAASYVGAGAAKSWIWQVARNALIDHQRRAGRIRAHEEPGDDDSWEDIGDTARGDCDPAFPGGVDECVDNGLERFGQQMPERAYVLTLYMDGLGIEEIGARIGRTAGATKEYLSQCRKKLQPFLEPCRELLAE